MRTCAEKSVRLMAGLLFRRDGNGGTVVSGGPVSADASTVATTPMCTGAAMNESHSDLDQHGGTLSTCVTAEHGEYHVSVAAGYLPVAFADIRPSSSVIELSIDIAAGNPSPRVRSQLIDAVFHLDFMHNPVTLLATLPLGDVDLLDDVALHCADIHTRAAGGSCLVDGQLSA